MTILKNMRVSENCNSELLQTDLAKALSKVYE